MDTKRKPRNFNPYHFIVTFPERVYPFVSHIDGQRVRWSRSYEYRLAQIQEQLGVGRYGLRLAAYRGVFHIIGAALIIIFGTLISQILFGTDAVLPAMFILAMLVITFQEFILQPHTYHQRLGKGITDWFSWSVPLMAYVLFVLY